MGDALGDAAGATYADAGLGGRIRRGRRPAILVVDFQRGFTDPEAPLGSDLGSELSATRRLLDAGRAGGVPVAFTAIAFRGDPRDAGIWADKVPTLATLRHDNGMAEIDVRLDPRPDEVVIFKQGPSAWHGDGFTAWLAEHETDTVLLAGATTSGCVRATAVDLLQAAVPSLVIRECVGDRAAGPHEASLFDLDAKYADVISLDAALDYLATTAARRADGRRR